MREILCFGDSNTYGLVPKTGKRYPWGIRWTSILNEKLGVDKYRVIEEGLVGRTTVFDDPLRDYRNASKFLPAVLETHEYVDLVIVMLGTNDCKTMFGASAEVIGKGAQKIITQIKSYIKNPKILLLSPIQLGENVWKTQFDPEFSKNSVEVSKGLPEVYQKLAEKENVNFLAASDYAFPSEEDQEHMTKEGHRRLADAIYQKVEELFYK